MVRMFLKKEVVEEVANPGTEISLEEARLSLPEWSWGTPSALRSSPRTSAASPPRLPPGHHSGIRGGRSRDDL